MDAEWCFVKPVSMLILILMVQRSRYIESQFASYILIFHGRIQLFHGETYPLENCYIAVENSHWKFVDLPEGKSWISKSCKFSQVAPYLDPIPLLLEDFMTGEFWRLRRFASHWKDWMVRSVGSVSKPFLAIKRSGLKCETRMVRWCFPHISEVYKTFSSIGGVPYSIRNISEWLQRNNGFWGTKARQAHGTQAALPCGSRCRGRWGLAIQEGGLWWDSARKILRYTLCLFNIAVENGPYHMADLLSIRKFRGLYIYIYIYIHTHTYADWW